MSVRGTIIVAEKSGRLGNRLFLFGHLIAFAEEFGRTILNPAFDDYASYFENTKNLAACRFPASGSSQIPWMLKTKYSYHLANGVSAILHRFKIQNKTFASTRIELDQRVDLEQNPLSPARYHFVQGWLFRAPALFARYSNLIREFFTPAHPYRKRINDRLTTLKQDCDLLIGIHIRQGDYQTWLGGKHYFEPEMYADLRKRVEGLFPNQRLRFFICSDADIPRERFPGKNVSYGPNHELEDLYCLAGCDYLIGPPSSYTMWASFYGEVPLYMIEDIKKTPGLNDFLIVKS